MTYSQFKSDYKINSVKYNEFSKLGEKVDFFEFDITGPKCDIDDQYTIDRYTTIAEPWLAAHTDAWSIGLHLRNVADELLQTIYKKDLVESEN